MGSVSSVEQGRPEGAEVYYELSAQDIERFWAKVDQSGECWLWTAGRDKQGYGRFGLRVGGRATSVLAHRLSFQIANGYLCRALQVDHRCHVEACVNPAHLRLTTSKQNTEHRSKAKIHSSSGVRGVYWHKHTKQWAVRVGHNRQQHHIGYFRSIPEAEQAAIAARNKFFTHNDVDRAS